MTSAPAAGKRELKTLGAVQHAEARAEDALSQRQADLDSLRAQRDQLGDRIDYSTVDVTFVAEQIGGPAPQQYEGFTGQIERGWMPWFRWWAVWC